MGTGGLPAPSLWPLLALLGLALLASKPRQNYSLTAGVPRTFGPNKDLPKLWHLIGQPKEFCILVSDTLRWYLEERFDFHAPERTTEEFLYELRGTTFSPPTRRRAWWIS